VGEDALRFVQRNPSRWNVILADPPYDFAHYPTMVDLALARLTEEGILVVEHSAATDFKEHPNFTEVRRYGSVHFSFFAAP
jgi:16S rRNA G966 N2-methylase RsmD